MPKIAIDARGAVWFRGTGIGTYLLQLINKITSYDQWNQYHLFWPEGEPVLSMPEYIFPPIPVCKERLKEQAKIYQYLSEEKIDLYHLPQNGLGFQDIPKGLPLVVTIHDLIPYVLPQTCRPSYTKLFLQCIPKVLERAELLITVSHHTKQDLTTILKIPAEKIVVVYEAPDEHFRPLDPKIIQEALQKYKLSPGYVLYVGGFSSRKNLLLLIEAYHILHQAGEKLPLLVLAGKPSGQYILLTRLIEKYGLQDKVAFPGFIAARDLPYLYNGASLFIYPSIYEGFGLPPLEAMACGTPTIASKTSSIPEIVERGAWLVDPYCPDELASAIAFLCNNQEQAAELAARGKKRAAEFSWNKTAYQTLLVYESILNS